MQIMLDEDDIKTRKLSGYTLKTEQSYYFMKNYESFSHALLFILWSCHMPKFVSLRKANKIPNEGYCTGTWTHMNTITHED